jgi:hypothetical protein
VVRWRAGVRYLDSRADGLVGVAEVSKFTEAITETANMARDSGRICYTYRILPGKFTFGASFKYYSDWLFKAYPGGRTILSVLGKQYLDPRELALAEGREK